MDISSIGPPTTPIFGVLEERISMSILRCSSSPLRNFVRKTSLVLWFNSSSEGLVPSVDSVTSTSTDFFFLLGFPTDGIRASKIISSTASSAFPFTCSFLAVCTRWIDDSTKSLTIDSTSLPT